MIGVHSRNARRTPRGLPDDRDRCGATLLELIVAVMVVGMIVTIVSVSLSHYTSGPRSGTIEPVLDSVAVLRRRAIATGRPVSTSVHLRSAQTDAQVGQIVRITAHPDGSVVTSQELGVDRLTGRAGARGRKHSR